MRPSGSTSVPLENGRRPPIVLAQLVEHQLATIVELQREPVPAPRAGVERAGAELVVHPARAGDGHRASRRHAACPSSACASASSSATRCPGPSPCGCSHARPAARPPCPDPASGRARTAPASATIAVTALGVERHAPVLVPDLVAIDAGARPVHAGAIQAIGELMADAVDVGQRDVRHVEVAHREGGRDWRARRRRPTRKNVTWYPYAFPSSPRTLPV